PDDHRQLDDMAADSELARAGCPPGLGRQWSQLMILPSPGVQGVVLSGGGAKGAYEAGVLKALMTGASPVTQYRPMDPRILVGTSVGAYNAAVLTAELDDRGPESATYLADLWTNTIPHDDGFKHNHLFRYRGDPLEFLPAGSAPTPTGGFDAFRTLLDDAAFFAGDWITRSTQFLNSKAGLERRALEL